jgi:hypothetical protein
MTPSASWLFFAIAACGARLLHADGPRQQVVVLCANEADGDLAPAEFYGPGGRRATGARLSLQSLALRRARAQPNAFYDGGYAWVVDRTHGALHRFPGDHTVRWAADGRALLLQGMTRRSSTAKSGSARR